MRKLPSIYFSLYILLFFILFSNLTVAECRYDGGSEICLIPAFSEWRFRVCDEAGSYSVRYETWCKVRGGVYHGNYGGCEGAVEFTEENIPALSQAFERSIHHACEINNPYFGVGFCFRFHSMLQL